MLLKFSMRLVLRVFDENFNGVLQILETGLMECALTVLRLKIRCYEVAKKVQYSMYAHYYSMKTKNSSKVILRIVFKTTICSYHTVQDLYDHARPTWFGILSYLLVQGNVDQTLLDKECCQKFRYKKLTTKNQTFDSRT